MKFTEQEKKVASKVLNALWDHARERKILEVTLQNLFQSFQGENGLDACLKKEDVCVLIENEAHWQEAKMLLEKYVQKTANDGTFDFFEGGMNYVCTWLDKTWFSSTVILTDKVQITLSELEQILIEEQSNKH